MSLPTNHREPPVPGSCAPDSASVDAGAGAATGEAAVLVALQRTLFENLGAPRAATLVACRGLSHFGEHALGWMGLGAVAALADADRRRGWAAVCAAAFTSHAASVILKRIVRRPRPHHPDIAVGVGTPSKLSFPSSHATSTTAWAVGSALLMKNAWPLAIVPPMMASRLIVGVHYPTDVTAGAALGASTAALIHRATHTTHPRKGARR